MPVDVGAEPVDEVETQHEAETPRVEIGSTWYRQSLWRTALNTECKSLMLAHAFDTVNCIAVEFRTATHNHRSRRAIERLGARLDGILRSHSRYANGALRDTCVYSITAGDWPAVRAALVFALTRPRVNQHRHPRVTPDRASKMLGTRSASRC